MADSLLMLLNLNLFPTINLNSQDPLEGPSTIAPDSMAPPPSLEVETVSVDDRTWYLLPFRQLEDVSQHRHFSSIPRAHVDSLHCIHWFVLHPAEAFAAKHLTELGYPVEDFKKHSWKIPNYRKLPKRTTSETFTAGGHEWLVESVICVDVALQSDKTDRSMKPPSV